MTGGDRLVWFRKQWGDLFYNRKFRGNVTHIISEWPVVPNPIFNLTSSDGLNVPFNLTKWSIVNYTMINDTYNMLQQLVPMVTQK